MGKRASKLPNKKGVSNNDSDTGITRCTSDGVAMQWSCGIRISELGNQGTATRIPKFFVYITKIAEF